MCDSKCGGMGHKCAPVKIGKLLLIVGGLNWGLIGAGMLSGAPADAWNVVHTLLAGVPALEALVYILVGVSAVVKLVGCKCKKCMAVNCDSCESCSTGGQKKM
ncbi:MAG: DUF378 domain-containing protein [bacterium]